MKIPKVEVRSPNLYVIVPVTIGTVIFAIFVAVWFQAQFVILLSTVVIVVAGLGFIRIGVAWQNFRIIRAEANRAEAEVEIKKRVLYSGSQGIVLSSSADVRYIPPTASERKMLPAVIEGEATPAPLDFFTAMLGTQQPYKIVAEQRRGKSYLGMHITDRAVRERREACIVIGTKYDLGEWPNAYRYLIKAELVQAGLTHVINETIKRNEIFKRSPLLRVFLDDWINTAIRYPRLAQEFLELAATEMLTAGIVPYFLLQGDGNDDWGNKKSAMLKNNFTGLWVAGPRDEQGDPIPQLNTAMLKYPGSREELPVRLPQGLPQLGASRLPAPAARAPEPNEENPDAKFRRLVEGGMSRNQAAMMVYGRGYAGDLVARGKRALGEI